MIVLLQVLSKDFIVLYLGYQGEYITKNWNLINTSKEQKGNNKII